MTPQPIAIHEGQLSLVADRARARSADRATSHEAAAGAKGKLRESQAAVLQIARILSTNRSGLPAMWTDVELLDTYDAYAYVGSVPKQSPSGVRTRRKELCDLGAIIDTGKTKLDGKRRHTLWVAV